MILAKKNREVGAKIAKALGIKHCRGLKIDIPLDGVITVIAEFYPEIDGVMQLPAILERYELKEKEGNIT